MTNTDQAHETGIHENGNGEEQPENRAEEHCATEQPEAAPPEVAGISDKASGSEDAATGATGDDAQTSHIPLSRAGDNTAVVIYDGQCPLCQGSIKFLRVADRAGSLSFLPLDDDAVYQRFPQLGLDHDQLMEEIHVVSPKGVVHRGAGAIRYLARRVPALWPLVPLLHVPGSMPTWRWLYRQVARMRFALGTPTAEQRSKPYCVDGRCGFDANKPRQRN